MPNESSRDCASIGNRSYGSGNGLAHNFLLPDLQLFLNLNGVEKPVIGRGLDSLIAGASGQEGRKAADMLSSFQAKRTRVGKGLGAFLKGQQKLTGQQSASEPAPADPQAEAQTGQAQPAAESTSQHPAPAAASGESPRVLRMKRQPRARSTPGKGARRNARSPRIPDRPASQAPAPETASEVAETTPIAAGTEPADAEKKTAAPANEEPAFQKPFIQERPAYLRRKPVPAPKTGPTKVAVSPNFRMTLLFLDWGIIAGCFAVAWNLEPGNHPILALCVAELLAEPLSAPGRSQWKRRMFRKIVPVF